MIDRIVLDCDSVIADLLGGLCRHFGRDYPVDLYKSAGRPFRTSYNLDEVWNITQNDIWANVGREFWANLAPLPWAFEMVKLLEDRFGAENICLLTRPVDEDGCIDGKRDWIRKHFPDYVWRCLTGGAKRFCASPRRLLIDDHEDNCKAFREDGGHTFLFPAPWNRRFREEPLDAVKEWIRALETLDKSRL